VKKRREKMLNRFCAFISFLFLVTAFIECEDLTATQVDNSEKDAELTENKDQTTKNLEYALSGECKANRKYLAYSEIAAQEGYPAVATLWRAAAAAEAIHANNHMRVLGILKSTKENLASAVTGEQYEFETMYPEFIKTAKEAGKPEAAKSMEYAFKVEQQHHKMFKEDLKKLEENKKPELVAYWICGVCGNTVPKSPPEICPICGSLKSKFFEIK
jgi:rubrerythrin